MTEELKETWIKVVEYASMPHLGLSRKLRNGCAIEFNNDGDPMRGDVVFEIQEAYLRVIRDQGTDDVSVSYYAWDKLASIKTIGMPKKK
ncbi:hypothetical protein [Desulfohalovibrio reitneri]|uniref:hypothetical protein n=1 Tax=Desulfohalovibrio reitneri TaxID=1307759 RepID=UPI0004A72D69|nr:hypothetical protein [Desulfohalovibrio reitneri]